MDSKRYKKHRKAQEAARQAQPQPMYSKGVRTDMVDAAAEKPKGKPPIDPRYPPAKYVKSDDFAYGGPTIVIPAHQPLIMHQPSHKSEGWPYWYAWLILSAILVGLSLTIVFVAFYVMGEFTEYSPVYKGYFG